MKICLIVGYRRPEYLELMLEKVTQADNYRDNAYIIALDEGFDVACKDVVHKHLSDVGYFIIHPPHIKSKIGKQSWCVLYAMELCCKNADEIVYYLEDDIMIGKDFFTFSESILNACLDAYCAVMSRSNNHRIETTTDNNKFYLSDKADYQGLGVAFRPSAWISAMSQYLVPEYFDNPVGYCKANFKSVVCGEAFAEQDGLQRRVIERNGLKIAYPHVPRCFHSGIYGYNRKRSEMNWPYEKKLLFLRTTIFDPAKMETYDKYNDSMPVPLDTSHDRAIREDLWKFK